MCGFCGLWYVDGRPVDRAVLEAMRDSLRHRGPDEAGAWIAGSVGLGSRRLRIIDLHGGRQPLANEDETVWIAYNGEVYNFRDLRRELEGRGHHFRTKTDTEVIVHLYEEIGPECVTRLRGMFAFAIWDGRRQQMVLARDRIGKKPLYYAHDGRRLAFASEAKALLASGEVGTGLDPTALDAYLTLDCVPAPLAIFPGVRKLPAGHLLICRGEHIHLQRYWRLPLPRPDGHRRSGTAGDYAEELLWRLREAVRLRLVSDVPLGVLLSGGVDSSTVAAMMAQAADRPIKTFSIGSPSDDFDERPYARRVAAHLGTQHHEFVVEPNALEVLPQVLRAHDEPFADSSAIPTYYVCGLARQHVTVALSGDGGDEVFGGYPWYRGFPSDDRVLRLPGWVRAPLLAPLHRVWPDSWRGHGRLEEWRQPDFAGWYAVQRSRFPARDRRRLFTGDLMATLREVPPCDAVRHAVREVRGLDRVTMMQYADLMTYLPEDLLVKVDRASMWHSLEVRTPLLDHALVEFAFTIPAGLRVTPTEGKYILKQVLGPWLPAEVLHRPKMGFGIPLRHWFRHQWLGFAREILLDARTRRRGYFRPAALVDLLDRHRTGHGDPTVTPHQIWSLLYLELWCREFLDQPVAPPQWSHPVLEPAR